MSRPPYRFFTPLNRRRAELIKIKNCVRPLRKREADELAMLQTVIFAMVEYEHPRDDAVLRRMERLVKKARTP